MNLMDSRNKVDDPVAAPSEAWVCGVSLAGIGISNPAGNMLFIFFFFVFCECCVLSGRALYDGPMSRPEETYRVCVCVCVCVRARVSVCHWV